MSEENLEELLNKLPDLQTIAKDHTYDYLRINNEAGTYYSPITKQSGNKINYIMMVYNVEYNDALEYLKIRYL